MIRFLLTGLLRDRSRSLFPVLVVSLGAGLTVLMHTWLKGVFGDIVRSNANFSTGHVKVMSKAYADNRAQNPNDLALAGVEDLMQTLTEEHPDMRWVPRIRFGGLIDVPDENGETRAQGPAAGLAVDMLSPAGTEVETLNVEKSLVRGNLPSSTGEILIGDEFAARLEIGPGSTVTLLSSTMYGSMAMQNFTVAGTVRFGINAMDRSAFIADISDVRRALDMDDAAGEILGFFEDGVYRDSRAAKISAIFNRQHADPADEFAPVMLPLRSQNDLGEYLDMARYFSVILSVVFVAAMSIVLWNVGLIAGLRRYGEMGLRLAIGEDKHHVYVTTLIEALLVGGCGSIIGTLAGLGVAWYLQVQGIDIGSIAKNSTMMISNVLRAEITPFSCVIGFLPGMISTVLGAGLAGIGIYRRQTAQLFKELEA